jgi:hypothetical protein
MRAVLPITTDDSGPFSEATARHSIFQSERRPLAALVTFESLQSRRLG